MSKLPESCPHSKLGPCFGCVLEFKVCLAYQRALKQKGLSILAAAAPKLSIEAWQRIDKAFSDGMGMEHFHTVVEEEYHAYWDSVGK